MRRRLVEDVRHRRAAGFLAGDRHPVGGHAHDVGALQRLQPKCFGKPAVVADGDADAADRRLEHREAEVTRLEEQVFGVSTGAPCGTCRGSPRARSRPRNYRARYRRARRCRRQCRRCGDGRRRSRRPSSRRRAPPRQAQKPRLDRETRNPNWRVPGERSGGHPPPPLALSAFRLLARLACLAPTTGSI